MHDTHVLAEYNLAIIHVGAYAEYLQYRLTDLFASNVHETPAGILHSRLGLDKRQPVGRVRRQQTHRLTLVQS